MILTDKKLRQQLSGACPKTRFIWLTDRNYFLPKLLKIQDFVSQSKVSQGIFIDDLRDCDDFALQMHAEAKRVRGLMADAGKIPSAEWKAWAFGECFGIKFKGQGGLHNLNIAACQEGVFLIEPQTSEIWRTDPANDDVMLIRM